MDFYIRGISLSSDITSIPRISLREIMSRNMTGKNFKKYCNYQLRQFRSLSIIILISSLKKYRIYNMMREKIEIESWYYKALANQEVHLTGMTRAGYKISSLYKITYFLRKFVNNLLFVYKNNKYACRFRVTSRFRVIWDTNNMHTRILDAYGCRKYS